MYTLGYIGIPFLYASEVAPVQLRAAVCGISTAVSWLFNFLVGQARILNCTCVANSLTLIGRRNYPSRIHRHQLSILVSSFFPSKILPIQV